MRSRDEKLAAPPRLCERSDRIGEILRREDELRSGPRAGRTLDWARRHKPRHEQRSWWVVAAATALSAWLVVAGKRSTELQTISAEPVTLRGETPLERPPLSEAPSQRTSATTQATLTASTARTTPPIAPARGRQPALRTSNPSGGGTPLPPHPTPAIDSEPDCSELTQQGNYREAIDCYGEQAQGTGVSAELALLEQARLQSRVFGDDSAALSRLEEYQSRFPRGALFREATLARIETLDALGRKREAREAIDGIESQVPEKAAQLSVLAGRLAAETGDCKAALEHLERARSLGVSETRLARVRAVCTR